MPPGSDGKIPRGRQTPFFICSQKHRGQSLKIESVEGESCIPLPLLGFPLLPKEGLGVVSVGGGASSTTSESPNKDCVAIFFFGMHYKFILISSFFILRGILPFLRQTKILMLPVFTYTLFQILTPIITILGLAGPGCL